MDKAEILASEGVGATEQDLERVFLAATAEREALHALLEIHGGERGSFAICKLVGGRYDTSDRWTAYDRIGSCTSCSREVVYDERISGGKVLVCMACAASARESLSAGLRETLDPMVMSDRDLTDIEAIEDRNRAQSAAGEHQLVIRDMRKPKVRVPRLVQRSGRRGITVNQ